MPLSVNQLMIDSKLLTLEELQELNTFVVGRIKYERALLAREAKLRLPLGSTVTFTGNDGETVTGTLIKKMRKYARVDTGPSIWRVPLQILKTAVY